MIFRGQTKDGEWVEGSHVVVYDRHFIISYCMPKSTARASELYRDSMLCFSYWHEIIPESIAQQTGLEDKNGTIIFGSIEIDGKMSRGGDKTKITRDGTTLLATVQYSVTEVGFIACVSNGADYRLGHFDSSELEITSNQFDQENKDGP